MIKADFHVHTEFSDDSNELMENQVERAIELGLKEICFTDHVDYGIKKDWEEGDIEWRGGDGVNYDPETRKYMQLLAQVNASAASISDCGIEVVYSIPVPFKGENPCV